MLKVKTVFLVGFVGGIMGYACGAELTPRAALAQSQQGSAAADAGTGSSMGSAAPVMGCAQWSVAPIYIGYLVDLNPAYPAVPPRGTTYAATTLDEGWEPFAQIAGSSETMILARRCVK